MTRTFHQNPKLNRTEPKSPHTKGKGVQLNLCVWGGRGGGVVRAHSPWQVALKTLPAPLPNDGGRLGGVRRPGPPDLPGPTHLLTHSPNPLFWDRHMTPRRPSGETRGRQREGNGRGTPGLRWHPGPAHVDRYCNSRAPCSVYWDRTRYSGGVADAEGRGIGSLWSSTWGGGGGDRQGLKWSRG